MNSREIQIIKKVIEGADVQGLIDFKKNEIQKIKAKPVENCYDIHVQNYCRTSFYDKKEELIKQYHYFVNLHEYLKPKKSPDSLEVLKIINNIENELLINL